MITIDRRVVNCFQILYIRSLNTIRSRELGGHACCELLSDFVYSFFEHNLNYLGIVAMTVVNCFQILYIRSLNTIVGDLEHTAEVVVNCFQILYIRSLNTMSFPEKS